MAQASIISAGSFDGVHLGHRAILTSARRLADRRGCRVVVLTFDPHPARTLRPGSEPPRLTSVYEKVDRLKAGGADHVAVLEPTPQVLGQSGSEFVERIVGEFHPIAIVEGEDFRFGRGRSGDVRLLQQLGIRLGFETIVEPKVALGLSNRLIAPVSSTLVRWLVGRGRMIDAAICLGRQFELAGQVVAGEQRGRTIAVPTANLDPATYAEHIVPADGVYAGLAVAPGGRVHPAAISVGVKPTFGRQTLTVEAHLLDFDGDLYGQTLCLRFARWLRDQWPYPNSEALRSQLARDIAQTRRWWDQGLLKMVVPPLGPERAG